jgi:hypothetical protein
MAWSFFDRGGDTAFPEEPTIVLETKPTVADLKRQLACLISLTRGQRRWFFREYRKPLLAICDQARDAMDAANEAESLLRTHTQKLPTPRLPYDELVVCKANGQSLPAVASSAPGAGTPEEYAAQCRRAAGPLAEHTVRLTIYTVAGICVAVVEFSVLHSILSLRWPSIAGMPEQAIGDGPVIAIFVVVVVSGYFAFRDCGERLEGVLKIVGRLATIPFLVGLGLFGAGSIIAGLSTGDVPAPQDLMELPQALGQGLISAVGDILIRIGDAGFAAAVSVTPILSFFALENCLRGIRDHGKRLLHSLHYRAEATRTVRQTRGLKRSKAKAVRDLERAQADLQDAPAEVAIQVINLSMPYVTAAESLLTQRELAKNGTSEFLPDILSEQVAAMDCNLLRKRLDAVLATLDPHLIEQDLRKSMKPRKKSKGD